VDARLDTKPIDPKPGPQSTGQTRGLRKDAEHNHATCNGGPVEKKTLTLNPHAQKPMKEAIQPPWNSNRRPPPPTKSQQHQSRHMSASKTTPQGPGLGALACVACSFFWRGDTRSPRNLVVEGRDWTWSTASYIRLAAHNTQQWSSILWP
jgi:hypothetical protein